MTRTERAVSPRAIIRDRSESKSGLDKSLRKGGAGPHNWGSIDNERELEDAAYDDEQRDAEQVTVKAGSPADDKKPELARSTSMSDEEVKNAKQFRTNAFKGESVDLAAIARTSAAVSTSPPK
jgi:hypothetical protein